MKQLKKPEPLQLGKRYYFDNHFTMSGVCTHIGTPDCGPEFNELQGSNTNMYCLITTDTTGFAYTEPHGFFDYDEVNNQAHDEDTPQLPENKEIQD